MKRIRSVSVLVLCATLLACRLAAADPQWVWTGAVTSESAVVHAGWSGTAPETLYLRGGPDGLVRRVSPSEIREVEPLGNLTVFRLVDLEPGAEYHIFWSDSSDVKPAAQFKTFPAGRASFSFAFAACAETGSEHPVFGEILAQKPDFFIHAGDLHYRDIRENDPARFYSAFQEVFQSAAQNEFFRRLPVIYMWDDHDYGPNDSHRHSPSREAALISYRQVVPHFPLVLDRTGDEPVAQAFTVGRVRFILTDLRSSRSRNSDEDGPEKTMMGEAQLDWFLQELLTARDTHAFTVWMSSVPWIGEAPTERVGDHWGAFANERRLISDFMVQHGIENIMIISGDAHMVGADDGRNNRFSSDQSGPAFPVYQAAALDRRGSFKGGPYSEGANPGRGQFGLVRMHDDGDRIRVKFEGRNHEGNVILQHAFTRRVSMPEAAEALP